jgi:hypothetical protein
MDLQTVEQVILDRFYEKSRMAGGPRTGYMLRKQAVVCLEDDHPDLDFEAGLQSLAGRGLIVANEAGNLLYLSEAGAEALATRGA